MTSVSSDTIATAGYPHRRLYVGLICLSFYFGINLGAEIFARFILPHGVRNHYVYALNALLHSMALLGFLTAITARKTVMLYSLLAAMLITGVYIMKSMWLRTTLIAPDVMIGYHLLPAVGALLFIWFVVQDDNSEQRKRLLQLGGLILTYYLIGLIFSGFNFDPVDSSGEGIYIFWIMTIANCLYYGGAAYVMATLPIGSPAGSLATAK